MSVAENLQMLHAINGVAGVYISAADGQVVETTLPPDYPSEGLAIVAQRVIELFAAAEQGVSEMISVLLKCSVMFVFSQKMGDFYLIVLCEQDLDIPGLKVAGNMVSKMVSSVLEQQKQGP